MSKSKVLIIIVLAQFSCTSLWFAGNAVMSDLIRDFSFEATVLGPLTSAVQFGFIVGTLIFAFLSIADRYSPSKVFFTCALLGALFNLGIINTGISENAMLFLRFFTGFCLAGIYPVGMKIAADYFQKGLGKALGFLVGALVLGTAFPHLLKSLTQSLPWRYVLILTSSLSVLGGLAILVFVPNGPFRKASQGLELGAIRQVFNNQNFRAAAFGYFGHMWELYTFWAFVPVLLLSYQEYHPEIILNTSLWSFCIIGVGGLACVIGAYISPYWGTKKTAAIALSLSGVCCLLSPFIFLTSSPFSLLTFLLFWGMMVVADSPLFSTLVAHNAPAQWKGTALTIVNCIGFTITIFSIQLVNNLAFYVDPENLYLVLAIGPFLGLLALYRKQY